MNHVKTTIAGVAGAVAMSLLSSNAIALPVGTVIDAAHTINFSGASAQKDTVKALFGNTFCDRGTGAGTASDTIDVFNTTPTGFVLTCTLKTSAVEPKIPAAFSGSNIRFRYRTAGGSIYGVNPVARQELVTIGTEDATCVADANLDSNTGSRSFSGCTGTVSIAPDAGASDVEIDLFNGVNLPTAVAGDPESPWSGLTAVEKANLDAQKAYGVVFAIAVNNGVNVAGNSLSYQSIQQIFSGQWYLWDQVPEVYQGGAGTTGNITVCRRTAGSGTQAFAQVHFLREGLVPADPNVKSFVKAPSGPLGNLVQEIESSSTILRSCVDTDPLAIGISSIEKPAGIAKPPLGTGYGTNWRYVSIDGVPPTQEQAALGHYRYWVENSFNIYSGTGSDANKVAFLQNIRTDAQNYLTLNAAGLAGVLAIPNTTTNQPDPTFSSTYDPTRPINYCTRNGHAGAIPSCLN